MAVIDFPPEIRSLVSELKKLPGVGARSAERMAVWLMGEPPATGAALCEAVTAARSSVSSCTVCGYFSSASSGCALCSDPTRERDGICVVEQATDVLPIERSGSYRGGYHVLGGRLSPLDNVGPEDLRIAGLIERARDGEVHEVILALSSDVEGEATGNYLTDALQEAGVTVTRIAQGIPAGGGLEHADALTLARALSGRR